MKPNSPLITLAGVLFPVGIVALTAGVLIGTGGGRFTGPPDAPPAVGGAQTAVTSPSADTTAGGSGAPAGGGSGNSGSGNGAGGNPGMASGSAGSGAAASSAPRSAPKGSGTGAATEPSQTGATDKAPSGEKVGVGGAASGSDTSGASAGGSGSGGNASAGAGGSSANATGSDAAGAGAAGGETAASGGSSGEKAGGSKVAAGTPVSAAAGAQVYAANCVGCHQANGAGVPGAFPPLAGDTAILTDDKYVANVLLYGLQGQIVVKGQPYNGVMPAWSGPLNDAQIASVITYIRTSWGNQGAPISPDTVKAERAAPKTAVQVLALRPR